MRRDDSVRTLCGVPLRALPASKTRESWSFDPSIVRPPVDTSRYEVEADAGANARAERGRGHGAFRGSRRLAIFLVLLAVGVAGGAGAPGQAQAVQPVEVTFANASALRHALAHHPARLLRVVAPLHVAELQPTG